MVMYPGPHSMFCLLTLLEQPYFSTTLTGFLLELKDGDRICAKQMFLNVTLDACDNHQGKQSKAISQGHAVSVRPFILWPNFVETPSAPTTKNMIFVCLFVAFSIPTPSLMFSWRCNMTLALNVYTTYNREWSYFLPRVLCYLAPSREHHYKLNDKHRKSYLQCKAQRFFIVQIPLMKSTQVSSLAHSSKHLFISTSPFQKTNNYQTLMTCLLRPWT